MYRIIAWSKKVVEDEAIHHRTRSINQLGTCGVCKQMSYITSDLRLDISPPNATRARLQLPILRSSLQIAHMAAAAML